ncbi:MAG: hypothetical protein DDT42_01136 [candidate division WS2 bacterium]|uniref:Uncharacterized protein n=1 Tax=Psychracetigena formicireducens TaxID=2986056 RepID=A0A9E2BIN4_PSYF1|nr:hypothetical protein [Candidatus Psychracetigena formicireducens]MBT9145266.1 hypothetical protein [Candidatus Psychracetigena formicireducens]
MSETVLKKRGSAKRRIILTLLVALAFLLSFSGNVYGGPSEDDGRNNSIVPIQEIKLP